MSTSHIPADQLVLLLRAEDDNELHRQYGEHLANCSHCQSALDAITAAPKMWQKASELISEPLMSELAVKHAAASYGAQSEELTSDDERDAMSRDSAEFVLDPPSHPEMLGRIGDYDIEREVGRGGMGIVFKAFDTELHRPLAVKVLAPWLAQNATARKRFAREARAAAAVIHPNVISIYGVNASTKTPYLVMPFVAGPSLQRLIDEHGPLDEKDMVRIAMQVSAGLGAAHAQGLAHRDIKPANILVEPEVSRVLVTDFGLARAVDDASATHSGYFVGTPNYMSPEQATGQRADGRSDLFSLGSVIYFMATGRMPFRAESPLCVLNRISHDEPTSVRQVNSDVSQTLEDVVAKLLQKNPEDRFQTAGEVYEVMEKYLAYLHQPDVSKPPIIRLPSRKAKIAASRSRRWLAASAAIGVLVVATALAIWQGWLPTFSSLTSSNTPSTEGTPAGRQDESSEDEWGNTEWNPADTTPQEPADSGNETAWAAAPLGGSGDTKPDATPSAGDDEVVGDVGIPGRFVTVPKEGLGTNVDGYTLYLPESYSGSGAPYPVILYLQGVSGVGGEIRRVNKLGLPKLVSDLAQQDNDLSKLVRDNFVIISPHISAGQYFEDVAAMKSIIDEVADKHRADRSRIYVSGISRGGSGTWGLASRMEGVFAAAAPFAGRVNGIEGNEPLAKTPMWVAHNTGDDSASFTPIAKVVTQLNKLADAPFKAIDAGSSLTENDLNEIRIFMTGETDDHDAWSRVYNDPSFYKWLLKQRRQW